MVLETMDLCLQLLKKRNNSRFDSYSVRNRLLIISNITFRDSRVHIFSDHLSRNSCTHYTEELFVTTWKAICRYRRHSNGSELGEQVIHTYRITNEMIGREGLVNQIPVLTPEYLILSQWILVLFLTYSLLLRSQYLFPLHRRFDIFRFFNLNFSILGSQERWFL